MIPEDKAMTYNGNETERLEGGQDGNEELPEDSEGKTGGTETEPRTGGQEPEGPEPDLPTDDGTESGDTETEQNPEDEAEEQPPLPKPALKPRGYKPNANVLHHDYRIMLRDHPEAFDCIVFPARESAHNEINAVDVDQAVTLLDREDKRQEYDPPLLARAMLVPEETLAMGLVDSAHYEAIHEQSEGVHLILSIPARTYSLIQWEEYVDGGMGETVCRSVYIASSRIMGRTLNAGVVHTCFPLFAEGELPNWHEGDFEEEPTEELPEKTPEDGEDTGNETADNDTDGTDSERTDATTDPEVVIDGTDDAVSHPDNVEEGHTTVPDAGNDSQETKPEGSVGTPGPDTETGENAVGVL